mgnify:CR=1 FL=1
MHPRIHRLIRFSALFVTAVSLGYAAQRSNLRADITEEGLSQITKPTQELIASISPERPVVIHAYVSKEVPREYVAVRSQLLSILREMQARGGAGLTVRIVEPEPYSPEAQEAVDNYGISPQPVTSREAGRVQQMQLFLGVAFVSGPHEEVVPFLDRGLSPEYEIVRALRTVTQEKKKVVGVLRTDATIMGNFDLQARRQQPAWRVIAELKKQYEVRSLNPGAEIPEDIDVLLVPQLSSTTTPQLEFIKKYIDAGRPALLTVDPMPLFDMSLSPSEPMKPPPGQQQNMFGPPPQGAAPGAPVMDLIITVCDNAAGEVCPIWPGHPATAHWGYADPSAGEGTDDEKREAFRKTLHAIHQRLELLINLPADKLEKTLLQHTARELSRAAATP